MHDDRQFCLKFTCMDFCWCKEVALPDMQKKELVNFIKSAKICPIFRSKSRLVFKMVANCWINNPRI